MHNTAQFPMVAGLAGWHCNGILGIALSPDGRTLATGDWGVRICVWDLTDTEEDAIVAFLKTLSDGYDAGVEIVRTATTA